MSTALEWRKLWTGCDVFQTFRRQGLFEILLADAVNAMACQFFTALVDKKPVLIRRLRGDAVFSDIELEEMASFWLELYKPEPISFPRIAIVLFRESK